MLMAHNQRLKSPIVKYLLNTPKPKLEQETLISITIAQ
jgi:hypothetical protein